MPRALLGPPVGSLTEPALRRVAVQLCAYSGRGACEIEGRRDAARRGARATLGFLTPKVEGELRATVHEVCVAGDCIIV